MDTVVLDGASVDRDFAPGVLKFTAWPEQPHLVLSMARFNTKLLATYSVNVEHTSVSTCHRPERTLIREHVWLSTGSAYIECHPLFGVWTLLIFMLLLRWGCCSGLHGVEAVSGEIIPLPLLPSANRCGLKGATNTA